MVASDKKAVVRRKSLQKQTAVKKVKALPKVPEKIRNVIVVSDTHCGCKLGLIGDEIMVADGGSYVPSRLQKVVWNWWEEFWGEWVPHVTHGQPYHVVVNGDMVEGVHHRATSPISHNLEDQADIAYEVFKPIVEKCEGRIYLVAGTPAHVGESAVDEEKMGKRLGTRRNLDGRFAWWEIWMRVGDGLVHFNHHIGTTASSHHETSAVNAELGMAFVEAGRWGHEPPDILVRSHRHRSSEIRLPSRKGYATAFVTPAWQLKTPFLYKVAGGRMTLPQIGGSLIRAGDEELYTRHFVRDVERDPVEGEIVGN